MTRLSIIPQWLSASFLPVQTLFGCHYKSVHVRERAPVCLGPSDTAALLMAVCFCVRLQDVLFSLFPETGTLQEHEQESL